MKKILVCLFMFLCLFSSAGAESLEDQLEAQLDALPLEDMEKINLQTFPDSDMRTLITSLARGEAVLDAQTLLHTLFRSLMATLAQSLKSLAHLMVPAIFCGVMERLKSSFTASALGDVLCAACFLMVAAVMASTVLSAGVPPALMTRRGVCLPMN